MPKNGFAFRDVVGIRWHSEGCLYDLQSFARDNNGKVVGHFIGILEGKHHLLPGLDFKAGLVVLQAGQGADINFQGRSRKCNCRI